MIMMIAPSVIEFGLKDHSLAIKCSKPDPFTGLNLIPKKMDKI